jgi:hypothetical protein
MLAAPTTVIQFEGLGDATPLINQYAGLGVSFANATILTAGMSLNEFDFPPKSGSNVASDDGGPMVLTFSTSASFVGGYFTYGEPLTLQAFDSSNNLVASAFSVFSANFVSSGNPPNEFLSLSAPNIARVTITGDPAGGSFTLDNLTFTPIPEPSTFLLLGAGIATIGLLRSRSKRTC